MNPLPPQEPIAPAPQASVGSPQVVPTEAHNTSPAKWLGILCILFVGLCAGGFFLFTRFSPTHMVSTPPVSPTPMQNNGIPSATKTTDLAPGLPSSQKTVLTIEDSDSSLEKVILPTTQVAGYIRSLPEGNRVLSQTAAQ